MSSRTTDRMIAVQRPRFAVDDEPVPQLDADLLDLEVRQDEDGVALLTARFVNAGQASGRSGWDYRWFDGESVMLGKPLKVSAGEEDNEALLFSGAITAVSARFSLSGPPEISLRAEDAAAVLRMGQHTRIWADRTDYDIASAVVEERGFTIADPPVDGPTHDQRWQVNQTDLGWLRARARAVDARIEVGDTTFAFVARRPGEEPEPIALTTFRDLLQFEATADLVDQRTEVRVHGWSVTDKTDLHEVASADAVTPESGGGQTGPQVLGDLGWDAVENHHLEVPSTTAEAQALATGMMRRRARRFLTARGVTSGTPAMRVGARLDIADAGPWFSGFWTVAAVRHRFDLQIGFRTHFLAERTDFGGRG